VHIRSVNLVLCMGDLRPATSMVGGLGAEVTKLRRSIRVVFQFPHLEGVFQLLAMMKG